MTAITAIAKMRVKPLAGQVTKPSARSGHSRRSSMSYRSFRSTVFRENKYVVRGLSSKKSKRVSLWSMFNVARRLLVIAAAIQYIYISMIATWRTMDVLRSIHNPPTSFAVFTTSLIAGYAGDGFIYDSPLVQDVLQGDTTPRDYAIYLESANQTSTENCSAVPLFDPDIYNYEFLRHGFEEMANDSQYSIAFLADVELVVVVVDCTFTQLETGDPSMVRVFNVVRSLTDPTDVYLISVALNVQDYEIPAHSKSGPATVAILTIIQDMSEYSVEQYYLVAMTYPYQRSLEFLVFEFVEITADSFLELRNIPQDPLTEPVKTLITARERGFYNGEDQSNICYTYSLLNANDAKDALTNWEWLGEAVISDSWAWVHGIHFFFGLQTTFSLIVVCIVAYQNFRSGKMWIGDPFAFLSTASLILRGCLVVVSWYLNFFWTLYEFAISNASILADAEPVPVHKELVHADVLVVYLSLVGVISIVFRERIDPSIAIFLFEIVHKHRLTFIRAAPAIFKEVTAYVVSFFELGIALMAPDVAVMSPLWLWTAFQIPSKDGVFLAASFFPKVFLLSMIAFYAILRKVYRYYHPVPISQRGSQGNGLSANENVLSMKGNLTNFELSTGAELQSRFGLISDYSNYVFFKGMKFASADGVYCSGYVIVNKKFLVGSKDLLAVVLIKLFRVRLTNVYVYDVDGNTVKDTARLVYPHSFTWTDLWHLNVSVLL